MAEFDSKQDKNKSSPAYPSEYVRLEAGLIAKPGFKDPTGDAKIQSGNPRTILILSASVDKCDETAKSLRDGLGQEAVIIPCINTDDAVKWLNKGSIDLLLCGRNITLNKFENNDLPPLHSNNSIYGASLVLIRKSDPSLIAWIQEPGHLHQLSAAIAILNEEY